MDTEHTLTGPEWGAGGKPQDYHPSRWGRQMAARSHDPYRRGTIAQDRDGDYWRKGTAWWHWTGRGPGTGPGKLLWPDLYSRYGPILIVSEPRVP